MEASASSTNKTTAIEGSNENLDNSLEQILEDSLQFLEEFERGSHHDHHQEEEERVPEDKIAGTEKLDSTQESWKASRTSLAGRTLVEMERPNETTLNTLLRLTSEQRNSLGKPVNQDKLTLAKSHLLSHANGPSNKDKRATAAGTGNNNNDARRINFRCVFCNFSCDSPGSMKDHILTAHQHQQRDSESSSSKDSVKEHRTGAAFKLAQPSEPSKQQSSFTILPNFYLQQVPIISTPKKQINISNSNTSDQNVRSNDSLTGRKIRPARRSRPSLLLDDNSDDGECGDMNNFTKRQRNKTTLDETFLIEDYESQKSTRKSFSIKKLKSKQNSKMTFLDYEDNNIVANRSNANAEITSKSNANFFLQLSAEATMAEPASKQAQMMSQSFTSKGVANQKSSSDQEAMPLHSSDQEASMIESSKNRATVGPLVKRRGRVPKNKILEDNKDGLVSKRRKKDLKERTLKESSFQQNCTSCTSDKVRDEELMKKESHQSKLFLEIRKAVEASLKRDSEMCKSRIDGKSEDLTDVEIAELANSTLMEFGLCKEQHKADLKQCLDEIKRATEKKLEYKRMSVKLTKRISKLESMMKDQETEKNKKIATMQKNSMVMENKIQLLEKNAGKTDARKVQKLEGLVEQKTKAVEDLKEKLKSAEGKLHKGEANEAKIVKLEKQLKTKEKIILSLQKQAAKIQEIEKNLKDKDETVKTLEADLNESANLVKKMNQAKHQESNARSLLRVSKLENDVFNKASEISELRAQCTAAENRVRLLEKSNENFEKLKQLREKEGEQFKMNKSNMESRLAEQTDLIEILQWTFYVMDKRLGGGLVKQERRIC